MIVFLFYLIAILVIFTIAACIADGIGYFFPDWLDQQAEDQAETEDSAKRKIGARSSGSR